MCRREGSHFIETCVCEGVQKVYKLMGVAALKVHACICVLLQEVRGSNTLASV
jgi:hypothetical protein